MPNTNQQEKELSIRLSSVVLDCRDANQLADFYAALLGWEKHSQDPEWIFVKQKDRYPLLLFQQTNEYLAPVWPDTPDQQQKSVHLDFGVSDLEQAVKHALQCGAKKAEVQYSDHWIVMIDPAGHPFCLVKN